MTVGSSRSILGIVRVKQLPRCVQHLARRAGPTRLSPRARVLILAAACAVPLATPAGAFAHARLIRVEPADGAVVVSAPVAVHLFFNGTIRPLQGMRVVRNGGGSVLDAPARVISGGELVIPLRRPLEPGAYTVLWRALSDDGHPVAGITTFAVGAGQPRPQPTLVAPSEHRAVPGFERWLFLSGVLLAVGFAAFKFTMPRAAAPSLRLLATAFVLTGAGGGALVARGSLSTRFGLVVAVAVGIAILGTIACLRPRWFRSWQRSAGAADWHSSWRRVRPVTPSTQVGHGWSSRSTSCTWPARRCGSAVWWRSCTDHDRVGSASRSCGASRRSRASPSL